MNTVFGIGEEVYVKGIVKSIQVSSDKDGKLMVEYCLAFPSVNQNTFGNFIYENDLYDSTHEAKGEKCDM